ncbi:thioredoxin domain-containing protein [Fulvivirga kasyanovii]|uniref:Thioredoxin domain-containing protein n=2 Tax=Fulvivirga kasyanovii TaxID=396812 RepID=A0ABW9RYZ1_9BACT|nr:thioredoxin domain-containing protein [Fulvivirga kasyanovii]MTI28320.1 thioredoxin domain-containing protein [Fulvivirga kasyanovii]
MSQATTHKEAKANRLIHATSPYLLQHAYNPVNWYPWGEEALEKARKEDKPILVSIGYSSCHWCHVMERESFENDSIAAIMNEHFVAIKVDREERPDVDQIYMDAVQAMGQNGGWPLNVFLTSDQKPFYGGTYFPPQAWAKLLQQVATVYREKRSEVEESAEQLTNAIATSEVVKYRLKDEGTEYSINALDMMYDNIGQHFDKKRGGFNRAPKFPMPGQWLFLLRYYHLTDNQEALRQIEVTLNEIAYGGIYDQAGGGFARYSVDAEWLVPHFEKMLYDNGQLVSLYSEAYTVTGNELYKQVVYQTIEWLEREMTNSMGGFYSALDADSEGEEGKFYVWTKDEIEQITGNDSDLIIDYYNITEEGNWEEGKNILHKTVSDREFATKRGIDIESLAEKVVNANTLLLKARTHRVRPGLDDKALSGWNGLMLKGLVDAYVAFGEEKFLMLALNNAAFITDSMSDGNRLFRSYKEGKASIDGYLEDYAHVIDAFLALYQATFDEQWLTQARELTDYTLEHFYDSGEKLFFYTDDSSEKLIARKKEVFDNVIPASNSQMAINLYLLGVIYDHEDYKAKSRAMIGKMTTLLEGEPAYLYNWGILYTYLTAPIAEVAIVGTNAKNVRIDFAKKYYPNKVVMGTKQSSGLPLLEGKITKGDETTIYVCYNKTCKLPVTEVEEAFEQLK